MGHIMFWHAILCQSDINSKTLTEHNGAVFHSEDCSIKKVVCVWLESFNAEVG